jgi:hypothetical protein
MRGLLESMWACAASVGMLVVASPSQADVVLTKLPGVYGADTAESTPVIYQGQQMLLQSYRPAKPNVTPDMEYLLLKDLDTGKELARFGYGFSLGCAYVNGNEINVFASKLGDGDWQYTDIYRFTSSDMINWTQMLAVRREGKERLLNSSVTRDPQGYLMAYESDTPVDFCFKFARSNDLATWQKVDMPAFAGPAGNEYSACPTIRYCNSYYYAIYLHRPITGHNGWVSFIARSSDLLTWEYSEKNPILEAGVGVPPGVNEGSNNSDVDLFEVDGKTYLFYYTGDQLTWGQTRKAVYDAPMGEFLESYFPAQAPEPECWILLGTGLTGMLAYSCRKRRWKQWFGTR